MKIRKPEYYDNFKCIADKCPLTCCQEWKIYVDDDTLLQWKKLSSKNHPEEHISYIDGERVIKLSEEHKCPFLNDKKLCRLVIDHGDNVLSETCSTFPRQIHNYGTITEYSLTACCPAVVDEFNKGFPIKFTKINNLDIDNNSECFTKMQSLFSIRDQMIAMMQNSGYSCCQCLSMMFYILSSIYENKIITDSALADFTNGIALAELSNAIKSLPDTSLDSLVECNELLLDLSDNYLKEGLYPDYLNAITDKAEELSSHYDDPDTLTQWNEFIVELKEYELFFQNYLTAEIYTSLLLPGSSLKDMIASFEWIGLEFAVLRQALFLRWLIDDNSLSYESIRSYVCVISRMTGYDEADCHEYLKNSFKKLIWDWGYFALIIPFK